MGISAGRFGRSAFVTDRPAAVRAFRHEITTRGHGLTEMRFLDLLIWSGQQPDLKSRG